MVFKSDLKPTLWNWLKAIDSKERCWSYKHSVLDIARTWAETVPGGKALDLCCGIGGSMKPMAECGLDVTGIDIDPNAIKIGASAAAKERYNIKFDLGNMFNLPYPDNHFDFICALNCLFLTDTIGVIRAIDEMRRVLKPNGQILSQMPTKDWHIFTRRYEDHYKIIDANTIMLESSRFNFFSRTEPVCFLNPDEIAELFSDFDVRRVNIGNGLCDFYCFIATHLKSQPIR
jgi:ubiquinone/menaquinone biosynthesis C-methylase UbiE